MICQAPVNIPECTYAPKRPPPSLPTLHVARVRDFRVTGAANERPWPRIAPVEMPRVAGAAPLTTSLQCAYGQAGIHFRIECQDRQLHTTFERDGEDLWLGDSVEIFLWPDDRQRVYLQYVLNPLGAELTLLVPNDGCMHIGWQPWRYGGRRRVQKVVHVEGQREPMGAARRWTAEVFLPFWLLVGLLPEAPTDGVSWRGNVFRHDYDGGEHTVWAWCPTTGARTHACDDYGAIVFGG